MNEVVILFGSNIQPAINLPAAAKQLSDYLSIQKFSSIWKSKSIGYDGPDFLNMAVLVETEKSSEIINQQVLKPIEINLGRVRSENKNSPRTIDLDIEIYNNQIINQNFWQYAYCVYPISELIPHLIHPDFKITIIDWIKKSFSDELIKNIGKLNDLKI